MLPDFEVVDVILNVKIGRMELGGADDCTCLAHEFMN